MIKAAINFILEIGGEAIPLFSPSLKNASEDNKWRVRMETLEGIVKIAQQYRVISLKFFNISPNFSFISASGDV